MSDCLIISEKSPVLHILMFQSCVSRIASHSFRITEIESAAKMEIHESIVWSK